MSTSGRKVLSDALKVSLPGWLVLSTARSLDNVSKNTCVLWTAKRKRDEQIQMSLLTDEIELWVFVPTDNVDKIEDDLDDALLEVMEALEQNNAFAWQEAERGVLADKFSGWHLTVTCINNVTNEGLL